MTCATSVSDSAITRRPPRPRGGGPPPARRGRRRGARPRRRPARSRGPCRRRRRWRRAPCGPDGVDGRADGGPSVADLEHLEARPAGSRRLDTLEDRGPDGGGVLRARVVVGDDDEVGHLGRGDAHRVALVAVAVATGAGDDHEAARRRRAQGAQRGPDRLGGVGVVDDGPGRVGPLRRGHGLHPAGHVRVGEHGLAHGRGVLAEQHEGGRGHRGVGDVEVAGKARPQVEVDPGPGEAERRRVAAVDARSASRRRPRCRSS